MNCLETPYYSDGWETYQNCKLIRYKFQNVENCVLREVKQEEILGK